MAWDHAAQPMSLLRSDTFAMAMARRERHRGSRARSPSSFSKLSRALAEMGSSSFRSG